MMAAYSLALLLTSIQASQPGAVAVPQPQAPSAQAMQTAIRELASRSGVVSASEMELIGRGLTNTSPRVRYSAIAALSRIGQRAASVPDGPQMLELRKATHLKPDLVQALDDADFRIRGGAVSVLTVMGSTREPSVIGRLAAQYRSEPDAQARAVIVKAVGAQAPDSTVAHQLVLDALDDVANPVRLQAIRATFTYRPPEALPLIAQALLSMEPTLRQDAVHAIGLYGTSAKEHVGLLRNLLSVETDSGRIQHIRRAIAAVSGDGVR